MALSAPVAMLKAIHYGERVIELRKVNAEPGALPLPWCSLFVMMVGIKVETSVSVVVALMVVTALVSECIRRGLRIEWEAVVIRDESGIELARKRRWLEPVTALSFEAKEIDAAVLHEAVDTSRAYFYLALLLTPEAQDARGLDSAVPAFTVGHPVPS